MKTENSENERRIAERKEFNTALVEIPISDMNVPQILTSGSWTSGPRTFADDVPDMLKNSENFIKRYKAERIGLVPELWKVFCEEFGETLIRKIAYPISIITFGDLIEHLTTGMFRGLI